MNRVKLQSFGWILAILLWAAGAQAQTTEAGVIARLEGKPLFLRGLWAEDKLKFDASGKPEKNYRTDSFTVCGFQFGRAELSGSKLRIEGNRVGIEFAENGDARRILLSPWITIEVNGHGTKDFTHALDAIFADGLVDLIPALPEWWQPYATKEFTEDGHAREPLSGNVIKSLFKNTGDDAAVNAPAHTGESIKAPRLLHQVQSDFSEVARREKYSGAVQIFLWVDEDGIPAHIRIARPAGMGLDEQAIAAVRQYRFAPATRNGQPVRVSLYIDVNYKIFSPYNQ